MRRRHHTNNNCNRPKQIVYPVKENVVHCCSEETIKHVHPSHTTVVNHHLVKNKHVFPNTTSEEDTVQSVDVAGNSSNGPFSGNQGFGGKGSHHHHNHHNHHHKHGQCNCRNNRNW